MPGRRRRLHLVGMLAAALLAPAGAGAQEPIEAARKTAAKNDYSAYEEESIRQALTELSSRVDESPEGKIIESIEILPREVLEDRDLPGFLSWVQFLNALHGTTRRYVIDQEVLTAPGEPYRQQAIDETMRNLRDLRPLSLVLCVPVQGSQPDRVRLLVITKDIWSLRVNTNARFAGGKLETFTIQPSEENLFGSHQSIGGQFTLEPAWYSLGGRYSLRRIGGSRLAGRLDANVIMNRELGESEGSYGGFGYGQPLYSTEAEWAWSTRLSWRNELYRRTVAGSPAPYDADATPDLDDQIPYIYRSDSLVGSVSVTRSFGRGIKHDLSLAMEVDRRIARPQDLSAYNPAAAAEFVDKALPVSDTRVGPSLAYHSYESRYLRTRDLDTLGLQEDFPLGHSLTLVAYPVIEALKSTRNFVGLSASGAYTFPLADGLVRGSAQVVAEVETERAARLDREPKSNECSSQISDGLLDFNLRLMTPSFILGRFVSDVRVIHRYCNYLNRRTEFGGESRLRGYPSLLLRGPDAVVANLEFRTRPLKLWSVHLGGATFIDVGDAFDGFNDMKLKRSVGFGLRALFPFLDRTVLRADFGVPLDRDALPAGALPWDIVLTFRQAFPLPVRTPAESF